MQRCSEKAFAMCPHRKFCCTIDDATFADNSECAAFNRAVEDKPMTNADRIRAMSDEELVKFMQDPFCNKRTNEECVISYCGVCNQCVLDWLQQPVEEGYHGGDS